MTDTANKIRSIKLNKHIDFMLLGDPIKMLFLGLWAQRTELPAVYQTVYTCNNAQIRCNLWNLADNADSTARMFQMDGTINTGFDYCIIIYDTITRIQAEPLDKWTSIRDTICARQHPERPCKLVVLVVKTPRTDEAVYKHIIENCQRQKIYLVAVDNNSEGMERVKTLPEKLAGLVYQDRCIAHRARVKRILDQK